MCILIAKWTIKARLINQTPINIGTGKQSGGVDIEVIKDEEGKFYIPGSSFKGALRHFLSQNYEVDNELLNLFFGSQDGQSLATFYDLTSTGKTIIKVRDGVAIDIKTNIAKDGAKYDYEIVESGQEFNLKIEITIFDKNKIEELKELVVTIKKILENNDELFAVGAMTTKGFGILKCKEFKFYEFDFDNPNAKKDWLRILLNGEKELDSIETKELPEFTFDKKANSQFSISATFKIKSSLLIGAEPDVADDADKVPLKSNGKPVLSGTSLKGALRSRAIKIINTLGGNGEEILKETFGWADTRKNEGKKIKSRLIVHETVIENVEEKLKNGIKINRFTGGTIDGALFYAVLLWSKGQDAVHVKLLLKNSEDWEKGLLLLLLKDLWTSDLPLGADKARGAGILEGSMAEILDNGKKISLKQQGDNMSIDEEDKKLLEDYVDSFIKKLELCKQ